MRPPTWGPRFIMAGIFSSITIGMTTLIGLLITKQLVWNVARHFTFALMALAGVIFASYSMIRLRHQVMESIRRRVEMSVYVNVVGNIDQSRFRSSANSIRKSSTPGETSLLRKLRIVLMWTLAVVFGIFSTLVYAVQQLQTLSEDKTYDVAYEEDLCKPFGEATEYGRMLVFTLYLYYAT
mmetsp:Transcript_3588/g.6936  ORF Transcript_3588/g.6936 Transcript_3588/m.6936 type:complete len:181 (-) Transcript_3588:412-954(-)|eukprot:CAMPEP_0170198688 /NCGR_PEP_ID=MMETSP0040_2-20121228/68919_1 /TAXON_ID=641309 /ORGANISM="Lotharella oceanica, Strain CCMP622" /LENGTH=180 /DNA_ID=CAMNT_0010448721 /DNA_START=2036 /DNA_END=2578 /DNA_ORIENTATION=-